MGFGSDFKNAARTALDFIAGEGQSDRLKFTRYSGKELSNAMLSMGSVSSVTPKESVVLEVNPAEIAYGKVKLISKVPTSAPERFIVYDWGSDLTTMTMQGNTGNLLPGVIQSGGNPLKSTADAISSKIDPTQKSILGGSSGGETASKVAGVLSNNILMNSLTYNELISLSPTYRTFKRLEDMYENFDSSNDLLILEVGDDSYRGYFTDFSFTQTADMPWNWKYSLTFVRLVDFNKLLAKGSNGYPSKSTDGSTSVANE